METDAYDFPDWSTWRLEQRMADVMDSNQLAHHEPRRSQVARELTHLLFEIEWRRRDETTQ